MGYIHTCIHRLCSHPSLSSLIFIYSTSSPLSPSSRVIQLAPFTRMHWCRDAGREGTYYPRPGQKEGSVRCERDARGVDGEDSVTPPPPPKFTSSSSSPPLSLSYPPLQPPLIFDSQRTRAILAGASALGFVSACVMFIPQGHSIGAG